MTRSIFDTLRAVWRDRAVLLVVLGFAWLNFLLTVKWAHAAGSLNGWKRPWYALALTLAFTGFSPASFPGDAAPDMLRFFQAVAWVALMFCVFRGLPVIISALKRYWGAPAT